MLNRITLSVVFTLSFAAYLLPELSVYIQFAPLALFATLVFSRVFCSASDLNLSLRSLVTTEALIYVFFLPILMAGPCFESKLDLSAAYWLLTWVVLVLARLYMAVVQLPVVLEAFLWSGVFSILLLLPLSFVALLQSIRTLERFSPASFHPNLLAFLLAGYICVLLWKMTTGGWLVRVAAGLFAIVCAAIIFFASSRGSIVALLAGILLVVGMRLAHAIMSARLSFVRVGAVAAMLFIVVLAFMAYSPWTKDVIDYSSEVLQLTQSDRGLDTGFTGRLDRWNMVLGVFADGTWLTGHGLRFTDTLDPMIDNSYLVLLYELGLIPALLITWRFISVLGEFVRGYFGPIDKAKRDLYLAASMLMMVFIINNVVDRMLFGVGNPYSLVALLLFAKPRDCLQTVMKPLPATS